MPKTKPPYAAAFRRQMVELVQAGRTPAQLAREFDCTAQTIIDWVARSAVDSGKPLSGKDVLTTAEREELARLRRQVRQLQMERDILGKACVHGLLDEPTRRSTRFRAHEREPGGLPGAVHVPCARRVF